MTLKNGLKGLIWGLSVGFILLILSYLLPTFLCPDFFRIGPSYPTDQPICSLMINNPLRTFYPFPRILSVWIPWLMTTTIIGWIIGKVGSRKTE